MHSKQEILEALIVNMNHVIEDELMTAALKCETDPKLKTKLTLEDLKRYAKTGQRNHDGKAVTDYYWRETLILSVYEPIYNKNGTRMMFAVKRHLNGGQTVFPEVSYVPPPKPKAPEVVGGGDFERLEKLDEEVIH